MHNYSNMRNKQMVNENMPNFTLFQNFADSCLQNDSFFSWFREFALPIEKIPLIFAKMGTSVVYVLVGGGGGVRAMDIMYVVLTLSKRISLYQKYILKPSRARTLAAQSTTGRRCPNPARGRYVRVARWGTRMSFRAWWPGRGWHLIYVRTSIWVALVVLRTPSVDRVYRENLGMDWHIFTFWCWFDRAMPFAVRDGLNKYLWYVLNHSGHSGSAWASPIPFQNKRIDSSHIKVACFSSFYVKMHTISNKIKSCQYWEICWCVSHFRSKGFTVCAWRYRFFCHVFCRR